MSACATLPIAAPLGAMAAIRAVVLIDGVPEPRLVVDAMTITGWLDQRMVRISVPAASSDPTLLDRWQNVSAVVALPLGLIDGQTRWTVLGCGKLHAISTRISVGRSDYILEINDDWAAQIAESVASIWWVNSDGLLVEQPTGKMKAGPNGNRSIQTVTIDNQTTHVLQQEGVAWTVETAITMLSVLHRLELSLQLVPRDIARAELAEDIDLTLPVAYGLDHICEPYGLVIQRELFRDAQVIREHRAVRQASAGRPIRLRWARTDQPITEVLQIKTDRTPDAAQPWIARGTGWRVESTFELVGGWDPSLEGQSDATYDRSLSSDFGTYANVYRQWVLNEDGCFTASPYNRGPAYDLTTLFGQGVIRPRPLPFLACLTLDDAGDPKPPIVEFSTDSGVSWSTYGGAVVISTQRGAVYLDDTTLPSAFLTAAKAGNAGIRVTASLQSPQPVQVLRWRGNPFAGTLPEKIFHLERVFSFRRVDSGSIHSAAVQASTLTADQINHSNQLLTWLTNRMRREAGDPTTGGGRATLRLTGAWPTLRVGDRLIDTSGSGLDSRGRAEALKRRGGVVKSIDTRFTIEGGRGPETTVELLF